MAGRAGEEWQGPEGVGRDRQEEGRGAFHTALAPFPHPDPPRATAVPAMVVLRACPSTPPVGLERALRDVRAATARCGLPSCSRSFRSFLSVCAPWRAARRAHRACSLTLSFFLERAALRAFARQQLPRPFLSVRTTVCGRGHRQERAPIVFPDTLAVVSVCGPSRVRAATARRAFRACSSVLSLLFECVCGAATRRSLFQACASILSLLCACTFDGVHARPGRGARGQHVPRHCRAFLILRPLDSKRARVSKKMLGTPS